MSEEEDKRVVTCRPKILRKLILYLITRVDLSKGLDWTSSQLSVICK